MSLAKILLEERERRQLTQEQVVRDINKKYNLNFKQNQLSNIEHGVRDFSKYVFALVLYYDLPLEYIVIYNDLFKNANSHIAELTEIADHAKRSYPIPVIEWGSIAQWSQGEKMELAKVIEFTQLPKQAGARSVGLIVNTTAMIAPYPSRETIWDGDTVIVDPDKQVKHGDTVIARVNAYDEPILRKYFIEAGIPLLIALASGYENIKVNRDVVICGVVVSTLHKN